MPSVMIDDGQQEPLDPVPEQANRRSVKVQPVPIDDRMLDLPVVDHRIRLGQAISKCQDSNQDLWGKNSSLVTHHDFPVRRTIVRRHKKEAPADAP